MLPNKLEKCTFQIFKEVKKILSIEVDLDVDKGKFFNFYCIDLQDASILITCQLGEYGYRFFYEEGRMAYLRNLISFNETFMYDKWHFFKINNSLYVDLVKGEAGGVCYYETIEHFCIITDDWILDFADSISYEFTSMIDGDTI